MNVVLTVALVAVALAALAFGYLVCRKVLAEFSEAERAHRLERAAIMRAVVARSTGDLVMLDRVAGQAEQKRIGTVGDDPRRHLTRAEYDAMLRSDFEHGLGGAEDLVPANPEGMN